MTWRSACADLRPFPLQFGVERGGRGRVHRLLGEGGPAGGAERRSEAGDEIGLAVGVGGEHRRRPVQHRSCRRAMVRVVTPICSPWKEGANQVAQHVDIMADEMLALARRLAAAADRGAEARQQQGSHQPLHGAVSPAISAPAGSSARSSAASRTKGICDRAGPAADAPGASPPGRSAGRGCRPGRSGSCAAGRPPGPRDPGTRRPVHAPVRDFLWPPTVMAALTEV